MSALLRQMMADSPSGLWPLDEASGTTAFDRSGNGRNGTYTGTITAGNRSTVLGRGADFAGGYVEVPDHSAFSSHAGANGLATIEAWALADTLANASMIFAKGDTGGAYEWRINSHTDGLVYGETSDGAGAAGNSASSSAGLAVTGRIFHLAFTYDKAANLGTLYFNGVQVAQDTSTTLTGIDGTAPVQIGRRADGGGTVWDGTIQCAAYYPTALSSDRIKAHYAAGIRSGVTY